MNIRYEEDQPPALRCKHFRNSVGLWVGRKCAILPNRLTVIFVECILPSELTLVSVRLVVMALMLSNMLYLTASKVGYLNYFISLLKLV
jgi:hypothetical protein